MVGGDGVEAEFDVAAGDGIERPGKPVAEVGVRLVVAELVCPSRTIGIDRHTLFESLREGGHGALMGWIGGDLTEEVLRQLPHLVGGDPARTVAATCR